jgi:cytochrome c peroxidase
MNRTKIAIFTFFVAFAAFLVIGDVAQLASKRGELVLQAPTRVNATDNLYNNKVGIYWDTIRGATNYRIFRNTVDNAATAVDVGTTAVNFFFDTAAPANVNLFYWVRAENSSEQSPLSASDVGRRTNTAQQGGVGPLQPPPPAPAGNPLTAAKIELGKVLFWDEQLSSTNTVACGTCHRANSGGADPRITGWNPGPDGIAGNGDDIRGTIGVPLNNADGLYAYSQAFGMSPQVTGRTSTSHINAAYSPLLFWDGRATGQFRDPVTNQVLLNAGAALESQAAGPPANDVEMGHVGANWPAIAAKIASVKPLVLSPSVPTALANWIGGRTYPELFEEAFGSSSVTPARIIFAIASYERSLFSDQTPFDLDAAGIAPLTAAETRGRNLFISPAIACNTCHAGNRFTDNNFHYIGVRPDTDDIGREAVTGMPNDRGAFRTPSLRNLGLRRSFFHNGRFTTVGEVVDFYSRGGDFDANNKPNLIVPRNFTPGQRADLIAFLTRPLIDPRVQNETGPFERPALYSESNRVPQIVGSGRSGSGGVEPVIHAISPPIVGNQNFVVSVSGGLGGAQAFLVIDTNDPGVGTSIPAAGSLAKVSSTLNASGAGNGWTSVSVPIPDLAGLPGQTFYARWYVVDPQAANGFAVSKAARFTIFGESSNSANFTVAGRIMTSDGRGLRNAVVSISGPGGFAQRVTTGTFGYYQFENIPGGATYTINVGSRTYRFTPRDVLLTGNLSDFDFYGLE